MRRTLGTPAACRLEDMTWPQIAGLLDAGQRLCVLPVGATEQHGPHLPTGTDTFLVDAFCGEASARTGVPLLPTLSVSCSQGHTDKWPGTLSVPPRLLAAWVIEQARWVEASGFDRLLIVNAHAGNLAALATAVDDVRCEGRIRIGLVHWFALTPEIAAAVEADAADWHANAAETALMLHLDPELVVASAIRDDPDRTAGLVLEYTVAETSAEGLTGAPSTATADQGAELFAHVVDALVERIRDARLEQAPFATHPTPPRTAGVAHAR